MRHVWYKQCFDSCLCFLPQLKVLLKELFCLLPSIELLYLLWAWLKQGQLPKHCLYKTPQPAVFGTFIMWFVNGWDAYCVRNCQVWSRTACDFSFSVEAFGDQSVRKYLSNAHFNLLSSSDLCFTKMRNSLVLKMNIFAGVYCRMCGPLFLQGSVLDVLQQLLCTKSVKISLWETKFNQN